jgi:hypothetical protein
MGHENMTAGRRLASLVNGQILPLVEQLQARWEKLYPAVRNVRPAGTMVCRRCGLRLEPAGSNDQACLRRTIAGRHLGHPDADSPDEFVTVCPGCGAVEDFREIVDAD